MNSFPAMVCASVQAQKELVPAVPLADELEKGANVIKSLEGLSLNDIITKIANTAVDFAFNLLIAVIVLYIGRFIIRRLYRMVHTIMVSRRFDASLTTFVLSLIKMLLYFILIITIIGILGIETSSFLAIFASAGVALGMAMSGTIQNFAGGVLILALKPYKVGDYIEAQGYAGTVKAIQIFHTVINTIDNKAIIIPNGGLSTSSINNYSLEQYRRVDWKISLSYGTDYNAASKAILDILRSDDRVVVKYIEDDKLLRLQRHLDVEEEEELQEEKRLEEEAAKSWWKRLWRRRKEKTLKDIVAAPLPDGRIPAKTDRSPFVALGEMADNSINFTVWAWTHSSNYWQLFYDMNRRFYTELPQKGFSFPFPQMDVHISKGEE